MPDRHREAEQSYLKAEQARLLLDAETHKLVVRTRLNDFSLKLQHRDIAHLQLSHPQFPLTRLTPPREWVSNEDAKKGWGDTFSMKIWGDVFLSRRWERIPGGLDALWGYWLGVPEIHEGKTTREMLQSLLHEPIRRPIQINLVTGIGAFVMSGNNRVGACAATVRTTIPARAACFMWTSGDYPGDDAVRADWRFAAAPAT